MDPGNRLYWVYDVFGPQLPEATGCGIALELEGRIFLAHTRALIWTHFNERIRAYGHGAHSYRPPIVACHGHTHVPSVTRYTPPFSRLLYTNDAVRPQEFQARQACLTLDPDTTYLIVPGAFTLEEQRHPTFSFAVLDLVSSRVAMVSLRDLAGSGIGGAFPGGLRGGQGGGRPAIISFENDTIPLSLKVQSSKFKVQSWEYAHQELFIICGWVKGS